MGSSGVKRRRKPVRRLPKVTKGTSTATWEWEQVHSPYTFEGRMEVLGKFAQGAKARANRRRSRRSDQPRRGLALMSTAVAVVVLVGIAILLAL